MTREKAGELRRILVALNAAGASRAAVETAIELAERLQAEVRGLFIEDEDLLRCAALPFVRRFAMTGAGAAAFDMATAERELALLAARARRDFEAAARRGKVSFSFDIVRGRAGTALAAAAAEADLLVVEGGSPAGLRGFPAASAAAELPHGLAGSVLLTESGAPLPRHLVAVFDGSEGSHAALRLAMRLAELSEGSLGVLLLAGDSDSRRELAAAARAILGPRIERYRIEALASADENELRVRLRGSGRRLLVLGGDTPLAAGQSRERLLAELGGPILLVF